MGLFGPPRGSGLPGLPADKLGRTTELLAFGSWRRDRSSVSLFVLPVRDAPCMKPEHPGFEHGQPDPVGRTACGVRVCTHRQARPTRRSAPTLRSAYSLERLRGQRVRFSYERLGNVGCHLPFHRAKWAAPFYRWGLRPGGRSTHHRRKLRGELDYPAVGPCPQR